jgi:hypothetical protein
MRLNQYFRYFSQFKRSLIFLAISISFFSITIASSFADSGVLKIEKTTYHGWQDAWILSNDRTEAVVVPAIGRIMQFHFKGGEDTFWENRSLDGKIPQGEWENYGGEKTWPAPQSDWLRIIARTWPPPNTVDPIAMEVRADREGITLISPLETNYGIRIYRRIELERDRPIMKVTTTYEKVRGEVTPISVWTIAQFREPIKIYALLPERSLFPQGYHEIFPGLPPNLKVKRGFISFTRDSQSPRKIGTDASTLYWIGEKTVVRIDTPRIPGVIYPDNNSSAEVYTNPDPNKYVELEFLSPLKELQIGEKLELINIYTCLSK